MDFRRRVDLTAVALCAAAAVLSVLYRVAPYYWLSQRDLFWNLMPVGALALFAGARLGSVWGVLLPLAVALVTDLLLIGPIAQLGYSSFTWRTPVVYACLGLYFAAGYLVPRGWRSLKWGFVAALAGSTAFFLITNFAAWLADDTLYTKDAAGLWDCYVLSLPFHRNTLVSDVAFSVGLLGLYELIAAGSRADEVCRSDRVHAG